MNEVIVRIVSMPCCVHGFVKEDPEGDYNVYLRAEDSRETQLDTYEHELAHIQFGHLERARDLAECEAEADEYMKKARGWRSSGDRKYT